MAVSHADDADGGASHRARSVDSPELARAPLLTEPFLLCFFRALARDIFRDAVARARDPEERAANGPEYAARGLGDGFGKGRFLRRRRRCLSRRRGVHVARFRRGSGSGRIIINL